MLKEQEPTERTRSEFLFEEYRALRSEIELLYRLAFDAERNALFGIVLVYGFLFTVSESSSPALEFSDGLWFLPVLLSSYARWRISQYYQGMSLIGLHIKTSHEAKLLGAGEGWEHQLRLNPEYGSRSMLKFFSDGGGYRFWNVVIVLSAVTAIWQLVLGFAPEAGDLPASSR